MSDMTIEPAIGHAVQFYENDAFLVDEVSRFIGSGLRTGEAGIVIATPAHLAGLAAQLAQEAAGPYIALDAAQTLAAFMVDGWPDERRFIQAVGDVVAKAALAGNGRVRAFGEMVALLWEAGQRDAAVRLEDLWNQLCQHHAVSVLCAYPMAAFSSFEDGKRLAAVCEAHCHVHPSESAAADGAARNRLIVQLQHKAAALQAELDRRSAADNDVKLRIEQLADAGRRKDEFMVMLGHELRSPLAPIATALELMRLGAGDAARVERARRIIERQAGLMKRMVDDLLEVSRTSSGRIELRREKIVLGDVVERAVEMARPLIDEKAHTLMVNVPASPVALDGDLLRLGQVLANLLGNAAKYTDPNGLIVLTARIDNGEIMVSVRDNGIGLAPKLREQVFDLYVQGGEALERSRGGLGIGLTLVRKIVQLHGGTVFARSDGPGRGSEFVLRLPVPLSAAARAVRTLRRTPGSKARRILVVDDNVSAAETLAECLRILKHRVMTAHNGISAIEQALAECPDLVILDIGLPEMDGYELARRLRALPQLRSAVFVALTGHAEDGDVARARQSGFDHHLAKPLDMPMLTALIDSPPRQGRLDRAAQRRLQH